MLHEFYTQHTQFFLLIAKSCSIALGAWLIAGIVSRALTRFMESRHHNKAITVLLANTVNYSLIFIGLISALSTFGIDVRSLITGLGLTGFAVGFALKDTLANAISGIFILLYRPFKIGNHIKIATSKSVYDEGIVKMIDLRYTTLENQDGKVLIPNSLLFINSISIFTD